MRRIRVDSALNCLWLKLRPDTHQHYEYIAVEQVSGNVHSFINVKPWTQFFDLKGRTDLPRSSAHNITVQNCEIDCIICFDTEADPAHYTLSDFTFRNLNVTTRTRGDAEGCFDNLTLENCQITAKDA